MPRPTIDRTDDGPIVTLQGASDAHFERLALSGATGAPGTEGSPLDGYAVYCRVSGGSPSLVFTDVVVSGNARGIGARQCKLEVYRSRFTNQGFALELTDVIAKIDGSLFENSHASLDGGIFSVTNSVFARNAGGVDLYSAQAGNVVEFNTFVDSRFACGIEVATAFPNNIFARSGDPAALNCTYPGSIIATTDIAPLKLARPDAAPYDYHLLPGSSAIDTALASTMDHDFDGDTRPKGAGRDVGADEAQ